jgi:cytochrome c2
MKASLRTALLVSCMLSACSERAPDKQVGVLTGDPVRGRIALTQYACHACHVIPGITGSDVYVGPPLAGLASRTMIAGDIPNTPKNLLAWIRDPHSLDPATAMPNMGVREQDARDMAAYLSTLK